MIGVQTKRRCARGVVLAAAFLVTGCGGVDGVELNGKVFDWMGVSESAQAANKREPKLAERTGIVIPPSLNRLPEPGSEAPQDTGLNLNDPDQKRQMAAAQRELDHKAYCSGEKNWRERAMDKNAETARSPYGPCNQFIGNALQSYGSGQQKR
jgi:hypothetical protein